jgi:hypothetical protein
MHLSLAVFRDWEKVVAALTWGWKVQTIKMSRRPQPGFDSGWHDWHRYMYFAHVIFFFSSQTGAIDGW